MTDPIELSVARGPAGYALVTVNPDHDREAISLQIVRIGLDTDVSNEGQEFYSLTLRKAQILQWELARAIEALEAPSSGSSSAEDSQEASKCADPKEARASAASPDHTTSAKPRTKRSERAG